MGPSRSLRHVIAIVSLIGQVGHSGDRRGHMRRLRVGVDVFSEKGEAAASPRRARCVKWEYSAERGLTINGPFWGWKVLGRIKHLISFQVQSRLVFNEKVN